MVNNPKVQSAARYRALVAGTGAAVPEKILSNEDFTKFVETSDEWITTRTGIKNRHIAGDGETTATLAAEAARRALADAKMDASEIELIITATITPEMVFPATACFVQEMIGAVTPGHLICRRLAAGLSMGCLSPSSSSVRAAANPPWSSGPKP